MQSKICVLQVIPNLDVSGASQGCVDVANFLSEKNYNSYILTHSGPKTSEVKDYEYHTGNVDDSPTMRAKQLASIMRMKALQTYVSKDKYTKQLMSIIKD